MTIAKQQAKNYQCKFSEMTQVSLCKTSDDDKRNSRLLLYLRLANLRRCGGANYRDSSEFREAATALFTLLNGYTPKDDCWISGCTWLP